MKSILLNKKNILKKYTLITLMFLFLSSVVLFTSCTSEKYKKTLNSAQINTPDILTAGTLKVGVNSSSAPLATNSSDIQGIDVDVASAIAEALGLKVEIVDVGSNLDSALANKKVDMVMGVFRGSSTGDFTKTDDYISSSPVLFSNNSSASVPTNSQKYKISTSLASNSATLVINQFPNSELKTVSELKEAFSLLASGSVDFVAADSIIGTYCANSAGCDAYITAGLSSASGYCIGIPKSSTTLAQQVNTCLSTLKSNGVIDVIIKKWLGKTIDISNIPLTATASNQASQDDLNKAVSGKIDGSSITN